jgi:hypothetical protein
MNDSRFPVECYVCGGPIETPDELVVTSAGWDYEFNVPSHRECLMDGAAVS